MPLRNQPYLPLYVQDFLTDEKLIECSAQATGVYIRLMCIMHKSEEYGTILLKQKDKQSDKQIENFAYKVAKQMPYFPKVVMDCLEELISENVLHIDGDYLIQRRMVKDNNISEIRSNAGKKGGEKTQFAKAKSEAKGKANTEYENEYLFNIPFELQNNLFIENWKILISMPKWKKKPQSAIEKSLARLKKYDVLFALKLVENCISGNYQGLIFDNTDENYKEWKKLNPVEKSIEEKINRQKSIWYEMFDSKDWINDTAKYLKIDYNQTARKLETFLRERIAKDDYFMDIKELKSYFVSWVAKKVMT